MSTRIHLVFGWGPHTHEDTGGWNHYLGSGENIEEARCLLYEAIGDAEHTSGEITHGHIVDWWSEEIVYTWDKPNIH